MKLENCPFCGGESYMEYVYYEGPVAPIPRCKNKDCIGYSHLEFHDIDDVAIAAWNTRPIEAKLRAELEALEARCENNEKTIIYQQARIKELEKEVKKLSTANCYMCNSNNYLEYDDEE